MIPMCESPRCVHYQQQRCQLDWHERAGFENARDYLYGSARECAEHEEREEEPDDPDEDLPGLMSGPEMMPATNATRLPNVNKE